MKNIGNIIKKERIKQKITQKELAKDICSTSYLSKIESGKQIPQDEVKHALINRLQINLEHYIDIDEEQFLKENYPLIKNAIMNNDQIQIKKLLDYFKSMNLEFSNIENFYTFNLRLLRLYLMIDEPMEMENAVSLLNAFKTMEESLNDRQKFFYYENYSLYCINTKQYQSALSYLEKAGLLISKIQLSVGEKADYYYFLSTVYHKLHRTLNAIEYAEQALKLFTELKYPQQMVNCYIRIGLSHIQNGHYHYALDIFDNCYNICAENNLKKNYGVIYQNLGYIYALEGDSRGAISYYRKSLAVKKCPLRILITIHSMVKEYSKLNSTTSVETWCHKGLNLIKDHKIEKEAQEYVYHFRIYKMLHQLSDFDEALFAEAIDFFNNTQNYKNVHKYAILAGSLLSKREEYKKATEYYQKATEAMYAMKNIKAWEDLS